MGGEGIAAKLSSIHGTVVLKKRHIEGCGPDAQCSTEIIVHSDQVFSQAMLDTTPINAHVQVTVAFLRQLRGYLVAQKIHYPLDLNLKSFLLRNVVVERFYDSRDEMSFANQLNFLKACYPYRITRPIQRAHNDAPVFAFQYVRKFIAATFNKWCLYRSLQLVSQSAVALTCLVPAHPA